MNKDMKKEEAKLSQFKPGDVVVIRKIVDKKLKGKLLAMGFTSGEKVKIERVAPLGDPIEVTVKGYNVSLRKEEAEKIIVERGGGK